MMQPPLWRGLDNYTRLFSDDELFRKSLANTAIYSVFSVPLNLIVAFVLALLLNLRIPGRTVFRALFYFPAIIPTVATAILWSMLLNTKGGLVNVALEAVGIQAIPWLTSPTWTMPSLILLGLWGIGPIVVIFLAGLQDVPRDLYEAARLDGAGPFRLVRDVTIPILSPVILFNLIIGIIAALQVFVQPFVIFGGGRGGGGNPGDRSTRSSCTRSSSTPSRSSSSRWATPRRWPGFSSSSSFRCRCWRCGSPTGSSITSRRGRTPPRRGGRWEGAR